MVYVIFGAALFLAYFFASFVNKTVASSVDKASNPTGLMERVEQINDTGFMLKLDEFDDWAKRNNFERDCLFLAHTLSDDNALQVGVWWNDRQGIWVFMYHYKGKHVYDFVSKLNDGSVVSTSSNKDGILLPHPDRQYLQVFPNLSFDGLLQQQQITSALFTAKTGKVVLKNNTDAIREVEIALTEQMAHIKTIPLWRYRGVFWYLYRRNFLVNKPIKI
jgi:hypothetical protein